MNKLTQQPADIQDMSRQWKKMQPTAQSVQEYQHGDLNTWFTQEETIWPPLPDATLKKMIFSQTVLQKKHGFQKQVVCPRAPFQGLWVVVARCAAVFLWFIGPSILVLLARHTTTGFWIGDITNLNQSCFVFLSGKRTFCAKREDIHVLRSCEDRQFMYRARNQVQLLSGPRGRPVYTDSIKWFNAFSLWWIRLSLIHLSSSADKDHADHRCCFWIWCK